MERTVMLKTGHRVFIEGREGYIVRIKKEPRYGNYWAGTPERYIIAVRLIDTKEIVFARLKSWSENTFKAVPYENVEGFLHGLFVDTDNVTIIVR